MTSRTDVPELTPLAGAREAKVQESNGAAGNARLDPHTHPHTANIGAGSSAA